VREGGACGEEKPTASAHFSAEEGSSENYGYSDATRNYQETLNHALDRAMIRLLGDPGFPEKHWCLRRLDLVNSPQIFSALMGPA
jgi:hypothetical protein